MSSRDSWIPLAAGLVVGAGLLALLYKMFSGTSYSKINFNPASKAYKCDCKKGDIDSTELERKRLAAIRAQSRGTSPPPGAGWLDWNFGDVPGGWFPIIGGSTVFMALLGLVYQNFEKIKQFFGGFSAGTGGKKWKDPCEGQVRKPPPKTFKPCSCDN